MTKHEEWRGLMMSVYRWFPIRREEFIQPLVNWWRFQEWLELLKKERK